MKKFICTTENQYINNNIIKIIIKFYHNNKII